MRSLLRFNIVNHVPYLAPYALKEEATVDELIDQITKSGKHEE